MHATRRSNATVIALAPAPALSDRTYDEHLTGGPNAHKYWFKIRNHVDGPIVGPIRIVVNYLIIYISMHLPSLTLKRWVYRCLGMRLGQNVTIASGVIPARTAAPRARRERACETATRPESSPGPP